MTKEQAQNLLKKELKNMAFEEKKLTLQAIKILANTWNIQKK